jgi:ferrous iron transport protein B
MATTNFTKIALIGNPNSGKSSLFNALTGLRQQTSNFPGVTVEKKEGIFKLDDKISVSLLDLPGCYSLFPNSSDEKIVVNILTNPNGDFYPDLVLYVLDINHLERHLLLASQIYDLQIPMVLVINMIDTIDNHEENIKIDAIKEFMNVDIVKISTKTGYNIDHLKQVLSQNILDIKYSTSLIYHINSKEKAGINAMKEVINYDNEYLNKIILHHHNWLSHISPSQKINLSAISDISGFQNINNQINETMARFQSINPIVQKTLKSNKNYSDLSVTDRIDAIVTHKIAGPIIFFLILFFVFQAIFSWAQAPMEWIENVFAYMGGYTKYVLGQGWIANLLTDGILAGLSGVLVFVPQITLLFLIIAILEESGYMSRAVYLFDGIFKRFGMNGRSIVALVSSGACAVPAIMSTRTIGSWKERIITIMVSPLISCSARLPVYALLVAFVVPDIKVWGFFNAQGLVFMGLYLAGIIMAFIVAFILDRLIKTEYKSHLLIELPIYKPPIIKNIFYSVKEKVWAFIASAGKVIMIISIVLWFLSSFGPGDRLEKAENEAISFAKTNNYSEEATDNLIASYKLENSFAGILGKTIEPAIKPLGFDWKIGIALITSFAAREVFVGTMATIYSIGSADDDKTIREKMKAELRPGTQKPLYDPVTSLSLLIFYVFAMQCMSTLAVTLKETNSWKWTLIQLGYLTALAYFGSLIFYQIFS